MHINICTIALWSPPSQGETRGTQVQWRWFWRCEGGWARRRKPCRRTASLLTSPGRLLLYWSWVWQLLQCSCCSARSWSHLWCSSGPRRSHSGLTSSHNPLPSCASLCRPPLCRLFRSTLSPSSSAPSVAPCTAPASSSQTSPGDQDTTAWSNALLSCFPQTEKGLCVLCLDPGLDWWCLINQI